MNALFRFLTRLIPPKKRDDEILQFIPPKRETAHMDLESVAITTGITESTIRRELPITSDAQIQASSITRFFGDTFNPYSYSTFRQLYQYSEPSFYRDYQESYTQNPFTHMVTEYLMNECFANDYHFEGPGANVVERFFSKDNTRDKIKTAWRESIKKGNGFIDIGKKRGSIIRTRVLNTDDISVDIDEKTGERVYKQGSIKLDSEYLIHFIIQEEVGNPYGISIYRPNLLFLTALMDVGGDIMAALKRVAYAPIVAGIDFEGIPIDDRKRIMTEWKERLKEMESATQNFVLDKKHTLTLLGQGAAGARLLPTNDLIEPIIAVVLMNFGIPLGMYLQTGANKSIIDEQRKAMHRFYEDLRTKLKFLIESKIIPHITTRETYMVFNKPPLSTEEVQKEFAILLKAYELGLLSREYILNHMDIFDEGETRPKKKQKEVSEDAPEEK